MHNADKITLKANKIYDMVVHNKKQILTDNSCDFKLLEMACAEYIENNMRQPIATAYPAQA